MKIDLVFTVVFYVCLSLFIQNVRRQETLILLIGFINQGSLDPIPQRIYENVSGLLILNMQKQLRAE